MSLRGDRGRGRGPARPRPRPRLVRLVRQAKDRRLLLAGPAVRLDRYEHDLKAGSAGHGPVRLLASCTDGAWSPQLERLS